MADCVWSEAVYQKKDDVKALRQALKCLFQASWPLSLLADGTQRSTADAEETSTVRPTPPQASGGTTETASSEEEAGLLPVHTVD